MKSRPCRRSALNLFGALEIATDQIHGKCTKHKKRSNSDQGSTYTSPAYRNEAEKLGITLSYSRKGNCYDNASMENFYGHLKSETIYQMPFHQRYGSTRKELMEIVNDYIQWYNEERIQEGLGYLSPTNFFKKMNLETVAS